MLLTIALTIINLLLAILETRVLRIQSFDIAPIAIVILAQHGEGVILGALLVSAPYAALSLHKFRFLWVTLPLTILIGYLALLLPNPYMLVALYHAILALVAFFMNMLFGNYLVFAGINVVTNLAVARFYSLF